MSDRSWKLLAATYLAACLLLGGASAAGSIANAFLQIIAVFLILALLWRGRVRVPPEARLPLGIGAALLLIGLASLVPLPPGFWAELPFRGAIERGYQLLGIAPPPLPLSLAPFQTISSLLWLLPPAAMFLMVLQLRVEDRRSLAWVILIVAGCSIGLGAFQLIGGSESALRLYQITNPDKAVGFFANGNHEATLLLCALPFAAFLGTRMDSRGDRASQAQAGMVFILAMGIFLTVGIAISGSGAGYGLYLPAAAAAALIYRRGSRKKVRLAWVAAVALALGVIGAAGVVGPLSPQELSMEVSEHPSSRRTIYSTTFKAIAETLPVGTGLGTFATVYRGFEQPRVAQEYVNHAHNDYLEAALELGLPGILLIVAFWVWWVRRSVQVWRSDFPGAALARAASVAIGVVMAHTMVDYPIRTSAIAALFAAACALLAPSPRSLPKPDPISDESEKLRHLEVV